MSPQLARARIWCEHAPSGARALAGRAHVSRPRNRRHLGRRRNAGGQASMQASKQASKQPASQPPACSRLKGSFIMLARRSIRTDNARSPAASARRPEGPARKLRASCCVSAAGPVGSSRPQGWRNCRPAQQAGRRVGGQLRPCRLRVDASGPSGERARARRPGSAT